MQNQITAPFTAAQVDLLNQYQVGINSVIAGHPFTCANRSDGVTYPEGKTDDSKATHGQEGGDRGILIATESGWVCPHCGHTQDWAHETMAVPSPVDTEDLLASAVKTGGIDPKQFLLDRTEKVIAEFFALHQSRRLCFNNSQTEEENDKTSRIWDVVPVMLASLRRRRMHLMGVNIAPDKTFVSIDPSWHDIKTCKPKDGVNVHVLWQDQPYLFSGSTNAVGGVSNAGHEGYGCNAWIDVRSFYEGSVLSVGGGATHWREIAAIPLAAALLPTQALPESLVNRAQHWWCPDVCPITGRPFSCWVEHYKTGKPVPTYGSQFDSYTIPVRDKDGCYCCDHYDHDEGAWEADADHDVGIQIIDDQREHHEFGTVEALEAQLAQAKMLIEKQQAEIKNAAIQTQMERQQDVMRVALEALEGCYGHTTRDGVKRTRAIQQLRGEVLPDNVVEMGEVPAGIKALLSNKPAIGPCGQCKSSADPCYCGNVNTGGN